VLATLTYAAFSAYTLLQSITAQGGRTTTLAYSAPSLTSITNPDGGVHTFAYDANKRLTGDTFVGLQDQWAYASSGMLATYTWGGAGSPSATGVSPAAAVGLSAAAAGTVLAKLTDPDGHTTAWQLDAQGRPLLERAPDGGTTTWTLSNGYVATQTDPLNRTTTYARDAQGYPTLVTLPDGSTQASQYQSAYHALTTYTDERNNTTTYAYDGATGHLLSQTNALSQTTAYSYTANGLLQAVTDPLGHTTSTQYDSYRRQTTTTDGAGDVTSYTYDGNGNPLSTTDPLGHITTTAYDVMGRLTSSTGYTGTALATTSYAYTRDGLPLSSTDPLGNTATTQYDPYARGLAATNTDAQNSSAVRSTVDSYDSAGLVSGQRSATGWWGYTAPDPLGRATQTTDALGGVAVSRYDLAGQLTASRDVLGRWTRYAYDLRGRQTAVTDALGNVTTTAYDAAGDTTVVTDPLNHTTSYLYDAINRQTVAVDPLGGRTTTAYDAAGHTLSVTDPNNHTTSYGFDAAGRQTQVVQAYGTGLQRTTTTAYDKAGNVTTVTDPLNRVTTYAYDALNRQTSVTDPLGHTTTTAYDLGGNTTTVTDPLGKVTSYLYDALNRQTQATDPLSHAATSIYSAADNVAASLDGLANTTADVFDPLDRGAGSVDPRKAYAQTVLDAAGNTAAVIDPVGNRTAYVYDGLNRQVLSTDPTGAVTTTAYDAAGRVQSVTDRDGRVVTYAYDNANRETGETWKAAGGAVTNVLTFTYDAKGNRLTAASYAGTVSYAYDALDRLTAQTDVFGTVLTYVYDAGGRRTQVQDSLGGVLTSVYDAGDRLTSRQFGGAGQTPLRADLAYTSQGQLQTLSRYTDLAGTVSAGTTSYAYDSAMRLTGLTHFYAGGSVLASYAYAYDSADRVTAATDNGATTSYAYDSASELTQAGTATYSYDLNGNRTMAGYQTGTANQLTNDGTWTYTYDAEGDLTKKSKGASAETWTYGYDNRNRMAWAKDSATDGGTLLTLATYVYDAVGDRVEKDVWTQASGTTTVTRFAYDGANVWADLSASNGLVMRRVFLDGDDQLVARIDAGGTAAWYDTDRLGSTRDVVNYGGTAGLDRITYDAFGSITSESGLASGDRYKFTGREFDPETGLQFNRWRYFLSPAGIWTTEDPAGHRAGDDNLYRYVGNAPTERTDPSGLQGRNPPVAEALSNRGGDHPYYSKGTELTYLGSYYSPRVVFHDFYTEDADYLYRMLLSIRDKCFQALKDLDSLCNKPTAPANAPIALHVEYWFRGNRTPAVVRARTPDSPTVIERAGDPLTFSDYWEIRRTIRTLAYTLNSNAAFDIYSSRDNKMFPGSTAPEGAETVASQKKITIFPTFWRVRPMSRDSWRKEHMAALFHELTHLWANTGDSCYYSSWTDSSKKLDPSDPNNAIYGISTGQLIQNAATYDHFMYDYYF
jgi:RHS repeat-associated protein